MKFSIAGKIYDAVDASRLSMKDMLLFQSQVKELGREITWDDVTRWHNEIAEMGSDAERQGHPEGLWLTATAVWAARRAAGEELTFAEAVDVDASSIRFIADPEDHKKPAGKAKPRKGSGAAAKNPAVEETASVEP